MESIWISSDDQRNAHIGRKVTYYRGTASVEVWATIGQTAFKEEHEFGVKWIRSRDFFVRSVDLILDTAAVSPVAGDRIRETHGSRTFVYEVQAPWSKPPFRYSDPYRKKLRIHTQLVATEEGSTLIAGEQYDTRASGEYGRKPTSMPTSEKAVESSGRPGAR